MTGSALQSDGRSLWSGSLKKTQSRYHVVVYSVHPISFFNI